MIMTGVMTEVYHAVAVTRGDVRGLKSDSNIEAARQTTNRLIAY